MKNRLVKSFAYLFIPILLISIGSCATSRSTAPSANSSGPRTIVLDDLTISEDDVGGFTSWYCKDFISGERVVLEVGFFNDFLDIIGFVLYDGGFTGEMAIYRRTGLEHRWDWGPNKDYSFVIETDGTGLYYDFSTMSQGRVRKPVMYTNVTRDRTAFKQSDLI